MNTFKWTRKRESIAIQRYVMRLYCYIANEQAEFSYTLNEKTDAETAYMKGQIKMRDRILTILGDLIADKIEINETPDESKIFWRSIKKFGYPPDDVQEVLVTMRTFAGDTQVFEAVWNGRCWTDTYEGYYNFEKSEFGEKYAQVTHWAYMPEPPKEA